MLIIQSVGLHGFIPEMGNLRDRTIAVSRLTSKGSDWLNQ